MNLDDYKLLARTVKAPMDGPSTAENLGSFIAQMRARDQQRHRLAGAMALIFTAVGTVFVAVGIHRFPGLSLIGLGMVLSALYAFLKGRGFGRVDYAASAHEFLAAAAKRYRFLGMKDAPALVPLGAMVLGGALAVHNAALRYMKEGSALWVLSGYAAFIIALCGFSLIVTWKDWRKEDALLLREIRRRQGELQNA